MRGRHRRPQERPSHARRHPRERPDRPRRTRCCEQAERENRGRLKIFLGAAPGVGKTYEMLMSGARRSGRWRRCGDRRGRDAWPQGNRGPGRRASRSSRARCRSTTGAGSSRRWISTPSSPAARRWCWSMNWPTPMRRAAAIRSAISMSQELLAQRHRRLHHAQHPACREPERRRRADHPRPGARDGAGFDHRPRRRHRDHRHHARRPDQAARTRARSTCRRRRERAIENYFSPGNLTALRELALRRTAQRVDDQLLSHMQAHAISGPWAAGDARAGLHR